jgi:hypothetical protein
MVYSTGCIAEDSWRRGGWCALKAVLQKTREEEVGGVHLSAHQPPLLHESSATQPVLYTIGAVDFVPFS